MSLTLQDTLTPDAPVILDATCSTLRKWPRHATVRIDNRPEVHPDIVMDARELKFPDAHFDEIYCDPPHLIDKHWGLRKPSVGKYFASVNRHLSKRYMTEMYVHTMVRFGAWQKRDDWLDFVEKTNNEFYRCLKIAGTLHYKISEARTAQSIKLADMNLYSNFKETSRRTTRSNTGNPTYWLTMKPKPHRRTEGI